MPYALHEIDEETDVGAYRAYLGAQSDSDLFDIARHLDADRYPARLDAAWRELRRRHVLHLPVYTANEYAIRYAALFSLALSAVTLALTALMTPAEAADISWPEGIPDGLSVTQVARLFIVAILRDAVYWSVHLGLYAFLFAVLAGWTLFQGWRLRRRRARADVWRLVAFSWLILGAAMFLAVAPASAVPGLFAPQDGRCHWVSLLNPFD